MNLDGEENWPEAESDYVAPLVQRDYFAVRAMHQFLNDAVIPPGSDPSGEFAYVAKVSYQMADAMLKARRKK